MPTPQAKERSKAVKLVLNALVAAKVTRNIPDGKDVIAIGSEESCNDKSTDVNFDLNKVFPFNAAPVWSNRLFKAALLPAVPSRAAA
jgi:hypothetical protein